MNTRDDRDRSVGRLLRQSFPASAPEEPGPSCLDAETLGAWADGGLSESSQAAIEAHLSACSRCQRIVALLAKLPASAAVEEHRWHWGLALRWLVPLAAGTAAVALFFAVPRREGAQSPVSSLQSPVGSEQSPVSSLQSPVDSRQSTVGSPPAVGNPPPPAGSRQSAAEGRAPRADATPVSPPRAAAAPRENAVVPAEGRDALKEDDAARRAADSLGKLAAPARVLAPSAAPAGATAEAVTGARPSAFAVTQQASGLFQEIVSPAPLIRWRVGPRGLLQYSASGGAAWEPLATSVVADLVAGSSPSSSVCWVVGRAGTVLLTVDGRRFNRVTFPAAVDLAGVSATDARTAAVTAADGRIFRTSDGGSTWVQ